MTAIVPDGIIPAGGQLEVIEGRRAPADLAAALAAAGPRRRLVTADGPQEPRSGPNRQNRPRNPKSGRCEPLRGPRTALDGVQVRAVQPVAARSASSASMTRS